MIKKLPFRNIIILVGILLSVSGTIKAKGYEIKFILKGLSPEDSICYVARYYGENQFIIDTLDIGKEGLIIFEGEEELERGLYTLASQKMVKYFDFFVDQKQQFTIKTHAEKILENIDIKGSEENTIFFDYIIFTSEKHIEIAEERKLLKNATDPDVKKKAEKKIDKINKEVLERQNRIIGKHEDLLLSKFIKSTQPISPPEIPLLDNGSEDSTFAYHYYKDHFWDNYDLTDDGLLRTPAYTNRVDMYFDRVVLQHPDSIISATDQLISKVEGKNDEVFKYFVWYLTNKYETSQIMGFDKIFVYMAENYYGSGKAFWAHEGVIKSIMKKANRLKNLLIGVRPPDMTMLDTSFRPVSIYKTQADYLMLFFWDPDCGHCEKEARTLKRHYKELKEKGLKIYAIYTGNDIDLWKETIKKLGISDWIHVINGLNIDYHDLYDINTKPILFLLDKEKKIMAKEIKADQMRVIIENDLEKKGG